MEERYGYEAPPTSTQNCNVGLCYIKGTKQIDRVGNLISLANIIIINV